MKNQNAITQIAYIVTADYYTNGKPYNGDELRVQDQPQGNFPLQRL